MKETDDCILLDLCSTLRSSTVSDASDPRRSLVHGSSSRVDNAFRHRLTVSDGWTDVTGLHSASTHIPPHSNQFINKSIKLINQLIKSIKSINQSINLKHQSPVKHIYKVAPFYILQTGDEQVIFLDLEQNADHPKNLTDSFSQGL